jgi:hypothetical protein
MRFKLASSRASAKSHRHRVTAFTDSAARDGNRHSILSIYVHLDGSRIATSGLDAKIRVWSTTDPQPHVREVWPATQVFENPIFHRPATAYGETNSMLAESSLPIIPTLSKAQPPFFGPRAFAIRTRTGAISNPPHTLLLHICFLPGTMRTNPRSMPSGTKSQRRITLRRSQRPMGSLCYIQSRRAPSGSG